jgi:hypothetical protein
MAIVLEFGQEPIGMHSQWDQVLAQTLLQRQFTMTHDCHARNKLFFRFYMPAIIDLIETCNLQRVTSTYEFIVSKLNNFEWAS